MRALIPWPLRFFLFFRLVAIDRRHQCVYVGFIQPAVPGKMTTRRKLRNASGAFFVLLERNNQRKRFLKDFDSLPFHRAVAAGVTAAGYTTPTPIQIQAIPTILEGRDVMGLAQTGTGKTAAFAADPEPPDQWKRGTLRALIVAPTRELAEQIHDAFGVLGRKTGLRSATAYGGVSINPQINRFKRGLDILVACPGRLAGPPAAQNGQPVTTGSPRPGRGRPDVRHGLFAGHSAHYREDALRAPDAPVFRHHAP
jgi:hypothetical protein